MKSVLITGASRGLGRALYDHYLASGWIVLPLVRDPVVASEMKKCAPEGQCYPIVSDVCSTEVEESVNETLTQVGKLDLLINNAGIPGRSSGLENTSAEEAEELFNIHVVGALRVTRAAAPFLQCAAEPTIINISSRLASLARSAAGEFADQGFSYTYRIAKAAQNMLSVCLAEEFGPEGVAVFAMNPGQFVSESAVSGASISAAEAAAAIADWVTTHRQVDHVQFSQPNAGIIPW
ncbi:MAG: SDR family NAD(P)-dependent oxidoreductase [Gammaproteobacteria bacterium]|nr:SDR family NAD(P)-dependent oxidoreductase [Gammaproteobacteria bacterium]MDP2140830.1 SDR family NAD(P)-dependent oxidoreductase [Gammaproteobacteria bacterium]MDP2349427.1 SDR family NAD(P)-dependent oxidoreductase [Gammaproteobacteria bacterium]